MTSKAEKLLEQMRNSQSNWKRKDLESLYKGFGFIIRHGSNHDIVSHPDYPTLRDTLQRHRKVPKYNIKNAVKLVDKLLILQDTNNPDSKIETDEMEDNGE